MHTGLNIKDPQHIQGTRLLFEDSKADSSILIILYGVLSPGLWLWKFSIFRENNAFRKKTTVMVGYLIPVCNIQRKVPWCGLQMRNFFVFSTLNRGGK